MEKLDELSDSRVFTRLHTTYAYATEFPDLDELYAQLGLEPHADGLRLRHNALRAEVRGQIMNPH